jgi:hypothetical protein
MKAFPTHSISVSDEARVTAIGGEGGMDLRDYFAAKAMQSCPLLSHYDSSRWCYERADAMMRAREV